MGESKHANERRPKPIVDLAALVEKYRRCYLPGLQATLASCRPPSPLASVIKAACVMTPGARKHSHQYRIPRDVLHTVGEGLLERQRQLRGCGSFEELLDTVEGAGSKGFGRLAVYDTALRIGACIGQLPKRVYLHAGTRKGCETLLGREATRGNMSLSKEDFPDEVQTLEPHEIEDFMCIFKDDFTGAPQSAKKASRPCCTDDATLEGERREKRRC